MKGYYVGNGYMGYVVGKGYILFATENEYYEYWLNEINGKDDKDD